MKETDKGEKVAQFNCNEYSSMYIALFQSVLWANINKQHNTRTNILFFSIFKFKRINLSICHMGICVCVCAGFAVVVFFLVFADVAISF